MSAIPPPGNLLAQSRVALQVQVSSAIKDRKGLPSARRLDALSQWLAGKLRKRAEVTIRFVDAKEGRMLNRDFRGKDYATNVLTFVYADQPRKPVIADMVLVPAVVAAEARAQLKSLEHHYTHLILHGLLHLFGYDHEDEQEALEMEALEIRLLKNLGIENPYES